MKKKLITFLTIFVLYLAYILPGLLGHAPWKQDEGYTFGLIQNILETGDLVIPGIAGEPFMEKPPLYYITAAKFETLFSRWLSEPDAARLASSLFVFLTLFFTFLLGYEMRGLTTGIFSVILLCGTLGFIGISHQMITDNALAAGFSCALYGLLISRKAWIKGGILSGTGMGIAFLSKGLIGPGMILPLLFILPSLFLSWRRKEFLFSVVLSLTFASPWFFLWPFWLYQKSPPLFLDWFWLNNIGRFFGFANLGADSEPFFYFYTIPWFAWPAWPVSLLVLWRERNRIHGNYALELILTSLTVVLGILCLAGSARSLYALPFLVPLSVTASLITRDPPGKIALLFERFSLGFLGTLAILIWTFWGEMMIFGKPKGFSFLNPILPLDYLPRFNFSFFSGALLLCGIAFLILVSARRSLHRPFIVWTTGLGLVWGLIFTLLMPWIDESRSYQSVALSLKKALPSGENRLICRYLGECQRALFHYYGDLKSVSPSQTNLKKYGYWLVETRRGIPLDTPGAFWVQVWQGSRLGDAKEGFILYKQGSNPPLQ